MAAGLGDAASVMRAMKAGAKGFLGEQSLAQTMGSHRVPARRIREIDWDNLELRRKMSGEFEFERLVGVSPPIVGPQEVISQVDSTDILVFAEGETGRWKGCIVLDLNHQGSRREKPFVVAPWGRIGKATIKRKIIGHMKGTYTGA